MLVSPSRAQRRCGAVTGLVPTPRSTCSMRQAGLGGAQGGCTSIPLAGDGASLARCAPWSGSRRSRPLVAHLDSVRPIPATGYCNARARGWSPCSTCGRRGIRGGRGAINADDRPEAAGRDPQGRSRRRGGPCCLLAFEAASCVAGPGGEHFPEWRSAGPRSIDRPRCGATAVDRPVAAANGR
jgi:hypothetical protein